MKKKKKTKVPVNPAQETQERYRAFIKSIIIKPKYNFVYPEKDGLVYLNVIKIDKKGLADKNGNILLPVDYQDVRRLSDGMILLEKDKKYGFANNKGEIIIPLVYDEAEDFSEGLAPVLKDGKWGFINSKNETVIDFKFVGVMMPFIKDMHRMVREIFHQVHTTHLICGD